MSDVNEHGTRRAGDAANWAKPVSRLTSPRCPKAP